MKPAPLATRFAASFESSPIPNPQYERADRTCPSRARPDSPHAAAAPASFLPTPHHARTGPMPFRQEISGR
ncbi:MAG: hypothetical protein JWN70_2223 [Planctomycetaceae bacterium]|nr:hypothetical protein [Planctomycetaceae bacterium]